MNDLESWAEKLAETLLETADQPRRICELCVTMLDVTGAGISMVTGTGNHSMTCATDDVAAIVEELQLTLGEGPCVDAVRSGTAVLVPDLSEPDDLSVERWPAFMKGAEEAGVRAVFAYPLRIGAITVGAMDLYRDRPGDLGTVDFSAALMAADAAALALLTQSSGQQQPPAEGPHEGAAFQRHVHQATGMVQIQLGVKTAEAFLALRARAFATSRPLSDVALDVVERRVRFSTEDT